MQFFVQATILFKASDHLTDVACGGESRKEMDQLIIGCDVAGIYVRYYFQFVGSFG